ncbi:MAG: ArsR/SmtB family transcription factor [Micromonosporaceae bacterium]
MATDSGPLNAGVPDAGVPDAGAPDAGAPDAGRRQAGSHDVGPLFEALADPTRRQVVQLLSDGPRRAGDIAEHAGVSGPAMSRHLRVLLAAGIVADERLPGDARVRVFWLRPDSIVPIQAWLDQLRAHWHEQLQSFKRYIEGKGAP